MKRSMRFMMIPGLLVLGGIFYHAVAAESAGTADELVEKTPVSVGAAIIVELRAIRQEMTLLRREVAEIKVGMKGMSRDVAVIREDMDSINPKKMKYEYSVKTLNRLVTQYEQRNLGALINSLSKEGWEYFGASVGEGWIFRRPLKEKDGKNGLTW